jgi:hypothetical protein
MKINFDINNLILNAKSAMNKYNFSKAYEILKIPIIQGLHHADIFYLFGENCRLLRKYSESERYLIESFKFEKHSPFSYYSLGLLYFEFSLFSDALSLFKHFSKILVYL